MVGAPVWLPHPLSNANHEGADADADAGREAPLLQLLWLRKPEKMEASRHEHLVIAEAAAAASIVVDPATVVVVVVVVANTAVSDPRPAQKRTLVAMVSGRIRQRVPCMADSGANCVNGCNF